jgi:integrase
MKKNNPLKLKEKKELCFKTLLFTGARINEVSHIRFIDFDFDRKTLRLLVTKCKAKKKEKIGKPRTIRVPQKLIKEIKSYKKRSNKGMSDYVFIDKPEPNKKDFKSFNDNMYQTFMRRLKKANLDPSEFGLHNIRKTHGNWLNALGVPFQDICKLLGHDANTFLQHYASANIFDRTDRQMMEDIYGREYVEAMRGDRR